MSDPHSDQQQDVQTQQNEARMHAHLAQYTRALHDYTLALWTESRRVAQEKEKVRNAAVPGAAGPSAPAQQHHRATAILAPPAAGAQMPLATQGFADDTTPKAVTPPKGNPVDSATPTPRPASS